jgi:uncharacterized membrane protein YeiH
VQSARPRLVAKRTTRILHMSGLYPPILPRLPCRRRVTLLLNRHPIFWLTDARYLLVIIVASIATMLYVRWARVPGITLDVADALGLALFTVTGAQVAERAGMPAIICVLLGTMSGAAGGVIRDVLLAQVPLILQRGSLYATAAIVGATFYLVLIRLGISPGVASLAGMACVASLRLAAIFWRLELPAFEVPPDES